MPPALGALETCLNVAALIALGFIWKFPLRLVLKVPGALVQVAIEVQTYSSFFSRLPRTQFLPGEPNPAMSLVLIVRWVRNILYNIQGAQSPTLNC